MAVVLCLEGTQFHCEHTVVWRIPVPDDASDRGLALRERLALAGLGDTLKPGERSASTSNRNFRGRQGPGSRTHLVSPAMAAAAAVTGTFTDVRKLMEGA